MTKDNSKPSRERRAREAAQRQAEYSALSPEARIARLDSRLGSYGALRERARLSKFMVVAV